MRIPLDVLAAARRVLDGDESTSAAQALEMALYNHYPYEEVDDLREDLALYRPFMGMVDLSHRQTWDPYVNYQQLCDSIRQSPICPTNDDHL